MKHPIFALVALTILTGCDAGNEKGPAPLAREFMSVAFGIKPSDVAVYVKFASGEQEAAVRAEAGTLSCLIEATAADDERSPRFGWLVTSMQCGPSKCADTAASDNTDGKPGTCAKGDIRGPATFEERTIQAEECSPETDKECVGIDLEALQKASKSGEFKGPAVNAQ